MNPLRPVGKAFLGFLEATGKLALFTFTSVSHCVRPPFYYRLLLRQMIDIGYYSLPVVGMTTLFAGMALGLQTYAEFSRFSAERAIATEPDIIFSTNRQRVSTRLWVTLSTT